MQGANSKIKIALVDDHILLRDALAGVISNFDNCIVMIKANNGKDLIHQLKINPLPDLIILDINMPLMDGYETAKWIKEVRILRLLADDKTTEEISKQVFLSPRTIETIRQNMKSKAGVKTIAGLIMYGMRNRLIE